MTEETGGAFIFVDADGFLSGPPDEVPPPTVLQSSRKTGAFQSEFSMIHYLLRSSIVLRSDCPESSWNQFKDFSRGCAVQAERLTGGWSKVPNPAWVGDVRQALKSSGKANEATVNNIGVSFVLEPKIYAYCFPAQHRIEVSATAYNHLRTVNLLLWMAAGNIYQANPKHEALEARENLINMVKGETPDAGKTLIDMLLPFLFSLYFTNVNYSSLPILRAPDQETFMRAKLNALIQVQFLLAHEYAHLLLHEEKSSSSEMEREADVFAYELLLGTDELWRDDTGRFLTAYRWLFLYLALDRIIGAVLSGYEIDWVDIPIRDRELAIYPLLGRNIRFITEEERDCQTLGDALLFQAKAKLHERGTEWIRSAAMRFEEQHCFTP